MSMIEQYAAQLEYDKNRNEAIKAMIECDLLEGAALGIAKKVLAENTIDNLKGKQIYVYEQEIEKKFERACPSEFCDEMLDFSQIANSIRAEEFGEEEVCGSCAYQQYQREKDD